MPIRLLPVREIIMNARIVDDVLGQDAPPARETIENQRQQQLDAIRDFRRKLAACIWRAKSIAVTRGC